MLSSILSYGLFCSSLLAALNLPPQGSIVDPDDLGTYSIDLPADQNLTVPIEGFGQDPSLNASDAQVTCFTNPPAPAPAIYATPVRLIDCLAIFPFILVRSEVLDVARWTPSIPLSLPKSWPVHSCQITVFANSQNSRDIFQEIVIVQRAALILKHCFQGVPADQRFGGRVSMGSRQAFQVSMGGRQ